MLNVFLRLLTVLGVLYFGTGIGGILYGCFVNRMPIGEFWTDVVNPIRSFAALTLPILIPVLSVRLLWGEL